MKKQSRSSFSYFSCSILMAGLMALLFASCAANAPATKSATATVAERSTREQQQSSVRPSTASDPETVENRLTQLFDLCKSDDTETAAAYFVYRGPDKSREWKDIMRASEPVEKAAVKEICRRIKSYLDESEVYEFGEVKVERESEGEWHALEVSFLNGGETKKVYFAFLLINGQFAIGDIDG